MASTLATICKDNWQWRSQITHLAVFDLVKKSRGAVLGWSWFLIKPCMYIFCFWFALDVGLRAGSGTTDGVPYILWLTAGLVPWFFMQDMLTQGADVLRRYTYLVNKIKFPLSGISTIFTVSCLLIHFMLLVVLFGIMFTSGVKPSIYLLQLPLIIILMFVFFNTASIMLSQLSAISKDVANMMKALSTPFFWLSGVIFDVSKIHIDWIQRLLDFNPVTFFASAYRSAFCDQQWFWENTHQFVSFLIVFAITTVLMILVYNRLNQEVADVL